MSVSTSMKGLARLINMAIAEVIDRAHKEGKSPSELEPLARNHWISKDNPLDIAKVNCPSSDIQFSYSDDRCVFNVQNSEQKQQ